MSRLQFIFMSIYNFWHVNIVLHHVSLSKTRKVMTPFLKKDLSYDYPFYFIFFQRHIIILAHLSWKLKWAFLIAFRPSSVCLSVCLSVRPSVNFSYFRLLLQNHWANFNKLGTKHPWVKGIHVCSNEGPRSVPRGDN